MYIIYITYFICQHARIYPRVDIERVKNEEIVHGQFPNNCSYSSQDPIQKSFISNKKLREKTRKYFPLIS